MGLCRALIRVIQIEKDFVRPGNDYIWLLVPSRSYSVAVRIPLEQFPSNIRKLLVVDKRFHAKCDLNDPTSLIFKDWEEK